MKKSSKPVIFLIVLFLVLVTTVLLTAQSLKFKCEEMIRERTQLDEELKSQRSIRVNLIASYQMLTAEHIIKEYAINELGLVEGNPESTKKILIERDLIENIIEKMRNKNE